MKKHNIPDIVKTAAKDFIDKCGVEIVYMGMHKGSEAYRTVFPNDDEVGFPSVFLLKNNAVTEITGFEALDIIGLFIKD